MMRLRIFRPYAVLSRAVVMSLLALLCAWPVTVRAAATPSGSPPLAEQIQFDQEKAIAHMKELEERMFRLAELLREEEPEDSARLLMGVRQARQQLIVEQMRQATELLGQLDLSNATAEQVQIVRKLEDLRKLLLSANLDLEVKLQELRDLRSAQQKLRRLIERETRQREQTLAAAADPDNPMEGLQQDEQRNRDSAENLGKTLGPSSKASDAVTQAAGSMGGAADKLGKAQAAKAAEDQTKALKQLKKAQAELAQKEQELLKALEPLVRDRVIENLGQMLAQEQRLREATEQLSPGVSEGRRQAVLAVRALSPKQDAIAAMADQTILLVEETGFSVALPPALGAVRDQMPPISADLTSGLAGESVVTAQKQVEKDLEDLLQAIKDSSRLSKSGGGGQCKSCGGDMNKLLSEVKLLRLMQVAVNRDTGQLNDDRETAPTDRIDDRIEQLRQRQDQARTTTEKLHGMTCPDCLQGAS
jgi:hypothetical protein